MFDLWYKSALLAIESQQVIALRMLRFGAGGAPARREAQRMVTEKAAAATVATAQILLGRPPAAVLRTVHAKVRANRRRLTR